MKTKASMGWISILATTVLFVAILVVLMIGTSNLSGSANQEGLHATRQAIERATVLCYASEGYYPEGLSYLESHYGVQIDRSRYAVRYTPLGQNAMPTIVVNER